MNTEAWDKLIELEEQAASILVGPSTGRPRRYVSTRQRLNVPSTAVPAESMQQRIESLIPGNSGRLRERIQLTVFNQQGEKVKLIELAGNKQDVAAAVTKATGISVSAAGVGQFAVTTKLGHKADKRKPIKRKSYK